MSTHVVGMDEVGRGCWAGPVVAGAVILRSTISGVKDSKLLTRERRAELDIIIRKKALAVGVGWADVGEINKLGLTKSLQLAFARALAEIEVDFRQIIIDGNYNFLHGDERVQTMVDADALVPAVSAASIVAKVARDNYMIRAAQTFPGYNFEKHVGYGTKLHQLALAEHGVCLLHRTSFRPVKATIESAT